MRIFCKLDFLGGKKKIIFVLVKWYFKQKKISDAKHVHDLKIHFALVIK